MKSLGYFSGRRLMSYRFIVKFLMAFIPLLSISGSVRAQSIYGTVTNPNSEPVGSVVVRLYLEDGTAYGGYYDITDTDGYYILEDVEPPGTYGVGFKPPTSTHLIPTLETVTVGESDVNLDVTLEFGNLLSGHVRDTLEVGIADIDLNVYDQFTGEKLYTPGDNTNESGFYNIVIPSGTFRIRYQYRGDNEDLRYVPIELEDVVIANDTTINVVLEEGYYVSGRVSDLEDDPVVDADLDAEDSETGEKVFTPGDNTDENGEYLLLVPAGTYSINVAPLPENRLLAAIVYGIPVFEDINLDFILEAGFMLYGTVRDPVGAGVSDVDLDVEYSSNGGELFTPDDNTDESGFYQVILPQYGTFDVLYKPPVPVDPPYLAPLLLEGIYLGGDMERDVIVPSGHLLSGLVQDFREAGVFDVDIDAVETASGMDVPLVDDHTDSSGAFATVIIPGVYHLEFEPPRARRLAAELLPDYSLNMDTYIEVSLDTGMAVSGAVTDYTGNPMPDVRVIAVESSTQQEAFTPGNRTDLSGLYEILVKPDTYDLTYSPDPLSGYPDSTLYDRQIETDIVIDVQFSEPEPDTEPPTVTVLSPNGGESWLVYSNQTISWTASDNIGVTSIDIYYSASGSDGPYVLISTGETNDGSYDWNVPPTPTEDAWVKVIAYDPSSNTGEDISNAAFTIYSNPSDCSYIPGDTDHNGTPIELGDVIAMIGIYRGTVSPYYSCECPPHSSNFAPEADPNGNCVDSELSDVVTEIGAYRGSATVSGCVDCPGLRRTPPNYGTGNSPIASPLKSKATYPGGTDLD